MKVELVKLEEEAVKKAETYIPIAEKYAICKILASGCVEQSDEDEKTKSYRPIPPKWKESAIGKRMVMMYVLVGPYLKLIDAQELYEETPKFSFSTRQYDQFSQVFSQLERMKKSRDEELRNAAYAILCDYQEFGRLLSAEIRNILDEKNDLCVRLMQMIDMQTSPETIKAAMSELQTVSEELKKQQEVHAKIVGKAGKGR